MAKKNLSQNKSVTKPIGIVLLSAFLFGVSLPFSKILLKNMHPFLLSSFLYIGTGIILTFYQIIRKWINCSYNEKNKEAKLNKTKEAPLNKNDYPWLIAAIISGGILAPIFLMVGLKHTSATTASLLLNLDGVFTLLWARWLFKEGVGGRVFSAAAIFLISSAILVWPGAQDPIEVTWGAALIILACVLWGLDNNLTRHLSGKDPIMLTLWKGWGGGITILLLALIANSISTKPIALFAGSSSFLSWNSIGQTLTGSILIKTIILAMILGSLSFGASIVLYVYSLRYLGAARTSAYFGISPFFSAAMSALILGENLTGHVSIAALLMILGFLLLITEKHSHFHTHPEIEHDHSHCHDKHHQHTHEHQHSPHSHSHFHGRLSHDHPHTPDLHHRHEH